MILSCFRSTKYPQRLVFEVLHNVFNRVNQNLLLLVKKWTCIYRQDRILSCPLCSAKDLRNYDIQRKGLITIQLERCDSCGLIFQSPKFTDESLRKYYNSEYRFSSEKQSSARIETLFQRGIRRGKYIGQYLSENGIEIKHRSVYEIGCGYGGILYYFKSLGCLVGGADLSVSSIDFGRKKGLDLTCGGIELFEDSMRRPDIVILSHVLEHIGNPIEFLNKVRNKMESGSVLYIEVPGVENVKNDFRRSIQVGHLVYYNFKTIKQLADKCGFICIQGNESVQTILVRKKHE